LVINNEYRGVYLLAEKIKIDKNRVDIAKLQPTDTLGDELTGGYIVSIDRDQEGSWNSPFMGRTGSVDVPFSYVDPKYDELSTKQRDYIRDYITEFEYALDGDDYLDPEVGYRSYINIGSFIDYFIITELSKDLDGYRVSVFFHKDKDSKDGRLTMTPFWDYNICFGNANFFEAGNTNGWASDGIGAGDWYEIPFWWDKFQTDPYFNSLLKYRWQELRRKVLSTEALNEFIDSNAMLLENAQARNFYKFNILDSYVWPNNYVGGSYENEVAYLKNWLSNRILWIDTQMETIDPIMLSYSTIETLSASDITNNTSTLNGKVKSDGGSFVWERGFYWSEYEDPIQTGKKIKSGKGSGDFTAELIDLNPNTQYNFVAYSNNDIGTTYGKNATFTTTEGTSVITNHLLSEKDIVVYPNPFNENITIKMNIKNEGNVEITVFNIMGEVVNHQSRICKPGTNSFLFNVYDFKSNGNIYFYNILIDEEPVYTGKLVKQ
jgi:hypothetical protein